MIRAVVIDDEPHCCEVLTILLEKYCPEVKVEAVCYSAQEAVKVLSSTTAQLVFLDIEMPHMNGFQVLEQVKPLPFQIVFTTSYDQYAIKAIRFSALDYLLKPIDREELQAAVQKAIAKQQMPTMQQFEILLQKFQPSSQHITRIALPTIEGLQVISVNSIISCASSSNYTVLSLKDDQKLIVSRTLKEIEEMLEDSSFLRVHHSYLVNLNEIKKYIKGEGGSLLMSDGTTIDVSRSRKEALLKRLVPGKA